MHPSELEVEEFIKGCRFSFGRASGPGGQNRNKVETSVRAEHIASSIAAEASEKRTQGENRIVAIHRLRCRLALISFPNLQSNPEPDSTHLIRQIWDQYCTGGKIRINEHNVLFPTLLSMVMRELESQDWDIANVATELRTSGTQLIRFLSQYAPALERLNQELVARGRSPRKG